MKRRTFLGAAAYALAQSATPLSANVGEPGFREFAEMARAVAGGRDITLRGLIPDGSQSNLAPTTKIWTEATGIKVELEAVYFDKVNDRMTIDALADRATYDFAIPATFGVHDLAWTDVIQPITPFEKKYGKSPEADGQLYELGDIIGKERYGFQTDGDAYLMFYRRDFIEKESNRARYEAETGRSLEIPTTWEELDQQIRFFNRPDQGTYGSALFRNLGFATSEFWSRMHAKGVLPFDRDLVPQIDSDGAIEALEEMVAITRHLHPRVTTAKLFENWRIFQEQEIYCNAGWGGSQKLFNMKTSPLRDRLVYSVLPGGKMPAMSLFNWGWSYVIAKRTTIPDIAFLFAASAVSPELSVPAVREAEGYFDPFHEKHYADAAIRETYSPEFLKVHHKAMEHSIPGLYLPGHASYFAVLSHYLNACTNGEMTPRKAMRRAAREWQLISLDFGREAQRQRWLDLTTRYPAPYRALL